MQLTFLGANRQVTGSRYCLHVAERRILVDCGLFQERAFAHRNWDRCPIPPGQFDALLLTHAHIDHSGLIPRFVSGGFKKKIYATKPTVALAKVMLRDSAEIQMEDAAYKKKRHRRANRQSNFPEQPLYDLAEAERALSQFKGLDYGEPLRIGDAITVKFHDAGHILGSAMIEVVATEDGETRTIVFSGDIGQWDKPLSHDPSLLKKADYVIMESTYGDRDHDRSGDVETELARSSTRHRNVAAKSLSPRLPSNARRS
jgi:metallo-beta-lactamase family protein